MGAGNYSMELIEEKEFAEKVKACWSGKALGGGLGAPYEGVPYGLDLTPEKLFLDSGPNDDLEMQLLWLLAAEEHGSQLTSRHLARMWSRHIKYGMDEYGVAIRNLRHGLEPPLSGFIDNFSFGAGMGATIRSEIWSCLSPGKPRQAAFFAAQDAMVDHYGNGVWGEMFLAAAGSIAIVGNDPVAALREALTVIPAESQVARAVRYVFELHAAGTPAEELRDRILKRFGSHNFTDCVMNLAFLTASILYGDGDFIRTIVMCINFGKDTDCTAASCGALLGLAYRETAFPARWLAKLPDRITVSDFLKKLNALPETLSDCSARVIALAGRIEAELRRNGRELVCDYRVPQADGTEWLQQSSYLIFNDIDDAEAREIELELLKSGPAAGLHAGHRHTFAGTVLELTPFLHEFQPLHLFTFLRVAETHPDGLFMCCSNMGSTLWVDGKLMLNYHGRELMIPAFHRTEGGATFGLTLEADKPKLIHVRLLFPRRGTQLVLGAGEQCGFYLDDATLEI